MTRVSNPPPRTCPRCSKDMFHRKDDNWYTCDPCRVRMYIEPVHPKTWTDYEDITPKNGILGPPDPSFVNYELNESILPRMIGIILILLMMYSVVGATLHGLIIRVLNDGHITDGTEWVIIFWPLVIILVLLAVVIKLIGIDEY